MLHKLIATLRKRGAHGRTFPVQATEATQAAEMIADLLRQRDVLLEAARLPAKLSRKTGTQKTGRFAR